MIDKKPEKVQKIKRLFWLVGLSLLFVGQIGPVFGSAPRLKRAVKIYADGRPIQMPKGSFVTVCDWDNDGKKDLIVNDGNIRSFRVYLNQGSDSQPEFQRSFSLKAGGTLILGC